MKVPCHFNLNICRTGQVHSVWKICIDPVQVATTTTKTRLLVQRYALAGTHCAGKHAKPDCPLCNSPPSPPKHSYTSSRNVPVHIIPGNQSWRSKNRSSPYSVIQSPAIDSWWREYSVHQPYEEPQKKSKKHSNVTPGECVSPSTMDTLLPFVTPVPSAPITLKPKLVHKIH